MKPLVYFTVSCILLFSLSSCETKKPDEQKTADASVPTASVNYEPAPDKPHMAAFYALDHIRDWYPERVLPPLFDFNVDITEKSIVELWLLRNEIFARNGYLFDDAVLRGHFNQFNWYQPIFDAPDFKVQLSEQEQQFVDKVLAREEALLKTRYSARNGYDMVNLDHVYNLDQFKEIDGNLMETLKVRNFSIIPGTHDQLFHVYDRNHYQYIPNFITTDLYLQVLHKHFSTTLQKIEEEKFIPLLTDLLRRLHEQSGKLAKHMTDADMQGPANFAHTYIAIAYSLITNENQSPDNEMVAEEFQKVTSAEGQGSRFLDWPYLQYSQFTPRSNYTNSKELENYFRCVKWLNSAPILITRDEKLLSAVMIAWLIKNSPENLQAFQRYNDAIKFIVGEEDNLSIGNLVNIISSDDVTALSGDQKLKKIREQLARVGSNKIRPKGADHATQDKLSEESILFTAGRYTFDAEILSRLTHVLSPEPLRPFPKGLDVFASLGNGAAKNILLTEYNEQNVWRAFPDTLKTLQNKFSRFNEWNKNIYTKTFETIKTLGTENAKYPSFMKTPQWAKRNLSTSLAAWTELKHDMLLYAEQPYAAQAGEGGGPPPPMHISYVEPNIAFWEKSIELLKFQEQKLASMDLLTDDVAGTSRELQQIATQLLAISRKELAKENITAEEFRALSYIGGQVEYLTFKIFGSDHLPEKERLVALVADVYNNNGQYLEEAVGKIDDIYVIAEINGKPYLTKGAVFSYYEFLQDKPLTDQEWQDMILSGKGPARPKWINEIITNAPSLESKPGYSF
ncbi:MAG TPA: DUF3160 domain-containing protein [Chryseosolibacter sp.]